MSTITNFLTKVAYSAGQSTCIKDAYIGDSSVEAACVEGICNKITGTKSSYIKGVYTKCTCSGGDCTRVATYSSYAYIRATSIKNVEGTYTGGADVRNAWIGNVVDGITCGSSYNLGKSSI